MQNIFASKYNLLGVFSKVTNTITILSSFYSVSTNLQLEMISIIGAILILLIPSILHTIQLLNDTRESIQIINLRTKLNTHILYESFPSMSRLLLDCFALMLSVNIVMKVFKSKQT